MPGTFRCRVVTPTESLFDARVAYAMVPAHDGLLGVLPGRAPLVAQLGLGELTVRFEDNAQRVFYIEGGFMKIADDDLIVLAEAAQSGDRIIESDARAELASADARVVPPDAKDRATAADEIRLARDRARTKLRIAQHAKAVGV